MFGTKSKNISIMNKLTKMNTLKLCKNMRNEVFMEMHTRFLCLYDSLMIPMHHAFNERPHMYRNEEIYVIRLHFFPLTKAPKRFPSKITGGFPFKMNEIFLTHPTCTQQYRGNIKQGKYRLRNTFHVENLINSSSKAPTLAKNQSTTRQTNNLSIQFLTPLSLLIPS